MPDLAEETKNKISDYRKRTNKSLKAIAKRVGIKESAMYYIASDACKRIDAEVYSAIINVIEPHKKSSITELTSNSIDTLQSTTELWNRVFEAVSDSKVTPDEAIALRGIIESVRTKVNENLNKILEVL